MIKFLDIYKQDKKIIKDISKEWLKIIKNSDFILGKKVKEFENVFSKYCDSKYAVGCANGTDAIYLALKSLNLPENSEVIVPAMTWCSTAFSVINANLKPILVDIEKNGTGICPESLKKTINRKTKAVICPKWRSVDLDDPEEWAMAELLYKYKSEMLRLIDGVKNNNI